jgi:hypothetical protein
MAYKYGVDLVTALTALNLQAQHAISDENIIAVVNAMDSRYDTSHDELGPTLYFHTTRGVGRDTLKAMAGYASEYVRDLAPFVSPAIQPASDQWNRRAAALLHDTDPWGIPYIGVVGHTRSANLRLGQHRRGPRGGAPVFGTTAKFCGLPTQNSSTPEIFSRILLNRAEVNNIASRFSMAPASVIGVAETLGIRAFRAHFTEGGGNINRMYTTTDGDSRHDIPAELLQAMEEAGLSVYCENTECTNENHKYFERRSSKGFVCQFYAFCRMHGEGNRQRLFAKGYTVSDGTLRVVTTEHLLDVGIMTHHAQGDSAWNSRAKFNIDFAVSEALRPGASNPPIVEMCASLRCAAVGCTSGKRRRVTKPDGTHTYFQIDDTCQKFGAAIRQAQRDDAHRALSSTFTICRYLPATNDWKTFRKLEEAESVYWPVTRVGAEWVYDTI